MIARKRESERMKKRERERERAGMCEQSNIKIINDYKEEETKGKGRVKRRYASVALIENNWTTIRYALRIRNKATSGSRLPIIVIIITVTHHRRHYRRSISPSWFGSQNIKRMHCNLYKHARINRYINTSVISLLFAQLVLSRGIFNEGGEIAAKFKLIV